MSSRGWRDPRAIVAAGLLILAAIAVSDWLGAGSRRAPADRPVKVLSEPATGIRITAFGTSLTAGADWPRQLAVCPGEPLAVARVARPGANSEWGVAQLDSVVAQRPDVVLVEFSINDADLWDGLSLAQSAANHRTIVTALRAALPDVRVVLMTMNPVSGLRRLQRPRLSAYYDLYVALAEELGTGLLDLYPRWLSLSATERGLTDGLHPADAAASKLILTALRPLLGLEC